MIFTYGNKKFFVLIFFYNIHQVRESSFSIENFSFFIVDKFLEVVCGLFVDAKIFHILGECDAAFLTDFEKEFQRCFAGKDNSPMLRNVDFLASEFMCRQWNGLNEGAKKRRDVIFFA